MPAASPIILMIRHGRTELNTSGRLRGWENPGLSKLGILDAKLAGQKIKRFKPQMGYSSDLNRDINTLNIVANECDNMPFEPDYSLRTANVGEWSGMKEEETFPLVERWYREPWREAPSGESLNQFLARFYPFFDTKYNLAKTSPAFCPTVLVSHGRNIAAIYARATGVPQWEAMMPFPGGIMAVYMSELGGQSVDFLSDTEPILEDR